MSAENLSVENVSSQTESLAAADAGFPTYPTAPGYRVNIRSGPGTDYAVIDAVPVGGSVTIRCQCPGTTVSGPYGTTDLWDCIGNGRFVSDAYVHTGSDGYVAGRCG